MRESLFEQGDEEPTRVLNATSPSPLCGGEHHEFIGLAAANPSFFGGSAMELHEPLRTLEISRNNA